VHLKALPVVKMSRLLTTGCQDVSSFNSELTTVPVTKQNRVAIRLFDPCSF